MIPQRRSISSQNFNFARGIANQAPIPKQKHSTKQVFKSIFNRGKELKVQIQNLIKHTKTIKKPKKSTKPKVGFTGIINNLLENKIPHSQIKKHNELLTVVSNSSGNTVNHSDSPLRRMDMIKLEEVENDIVMIKTNESAKAPKSRRLVKRKNLEDSESYSDDSWEEEIEEEPSSWVIDRFSWFYFWWTVVLVTIVLYCSISAPLLLAFKHWRFDWILKIELVFEIFYLVDTVLCFFVSYTHDDFLVTSHSKIVIHYLTTNFFLDALSSIPVTFWHSMNRNKGSIGLLDRTIVFLRIVKLRKLSVPFEFLLQKEKVLKNKKIASNVKRFLFFLAGFLAMSHFFSGMWIFISRGNPEQSWLSKNLTGVTLESQVYVDSIYFIWTSIFTVGYGDLHPVSLEERIFTNFILCFGLIIYSFIVSSVSSLISSFDAVTMQYIEKRTYLDNLKREYSLKPALYNRINTFFRHNPISPEIYHSTIISSLPYLIKEKLLYSMHKGLIQRNFLFQGKSRKFLMKSLQFLVKTVVRKNEYIVTDGEFVNEVMFVVKNSLTVGWRIQDRELKIIRVGKYENFGETLVLSREKSPFSLKSKSRECHLMVITRDNFIKICSDFPAETSDFMLISTYNYVSLTKLAQKKMTQFVLQNDIQLSNMADTESSVSLPDRNISRNNLLGRLRSLARANSRHISTVTKNEDLFAAVEVIEEEEAEYRDSSLIFEESPERIAVKKSLKKNTEMKNFKIFNDKIKDQMDVSNQLSVDPSNYFKQQFKRKIGKEITVEERKCIERLDKLQVLLRNNII